MDDDIRALKEYAKTGCDEAFAAIVKRHMKLVYATCLRETGHASLAEDAAQVVFVILARKAHAITGYKSLGGWLYKTSRFVARRTASDERKLRRREATAFEAGGRNVSESDEWFTHEPPVNDALDALKPQDREAVLLRYFEGRTTDEIAQVLAISPGAAEKRILRAVDRMRTHMAQHGVLATAVLIGLLTLDAAKPAPAQCVEEAIRSHSPASGTGAALHSAAHQTASHILHGMLLRRVAAAVAAVMVVIALAFAASPAILASRPASVSRLAGRLPVGETVRPAPSHLDLGAPMNTLYAYSSAPIQARIDNGILSITSLQNDGYVPNEVGVGPYPTQPFEGNAPSSPSFGANPPDTGVPIPDPTQVSQTGAHEALVWRGDVSKHSAVFTCTETAAGTTVKDQDGKVVYNVSTMPIVTHFVPGEWNSTKRATIFHIQDEMIAQAKREERRQLAALQREYAAAGRAISPAELRAKQQAIRAATVRAVAMLYSKASMAINVSGTYVTVVTVSVDHGSMEILSVNDRFVALNSVDIVTIHYQNVGGKTFIVHTPPESDTISPILPLYVPAQPGEWHVIYRRHDGTFVVREVIRMANGKISRTFTDSLGSPAIGVYEGAPPSTIPAVRRTVSFVARIVDGLTGRQ